MAEMVTRMQVLAASRVLQLCIVPNILLSFAITNAQALAMFAILKKKILKSVNSSMQTQTKKMRRCSLSREDEAVSVFRRRLSPPTQPPIK